MIKQPSRTHLLWPNWPQLKSL